MSDMELKPCPCCGKDDVFVFSEISKTVMDGHSRIDEYMFWVRCDYCGLRTEKDINRDDAVDYWNTRTAAQSQSGWVPIEYIEKHFDFESMEPYQAHECVAMTSHDIGDEWEMVRLTRKTDFDDEAKLDIPAIFTYGAYVDSDFIKDTSFTHFMKITLPSPKEQR